MEDGQLENKMKIWKTIDNIKFDNSKDLLLDFKKKILKQVYGLIIFLKKMFTILIKLNFQLIYTEFL